jgi:hypothetical protein
MHHTRRALLITALLALTLCTLAPTFLRAEPDPAAPSSIRLVISYGDGVEKHFTALPFKEGMTVLDAMTLAQAHPRGIKLDVAGSGERAFLKSIDGLANEGGGKGARNWLYSVNGKMADRGSGVMTLNPGDTVLWSFGPPKTHGDTPASPATPSH